MREEVIVRPSASVVRTYVRQGVGFGAGCIAAGGGAAVLAGWLGEPRVEWPLAGAVFVVPAILGAVCLAFAAGHWRLRREPLVVGPGGEVRYRGREVVPAGAVRVVVRREANDGDGGPATLYRLFAALPGGGEVEFPGPYFTGFGTRAEAAEHAAHFGRLLGVPVREHG